MSDADPKITRRALLQSAGAAALGLAFGLGPAVAAPLPAYTGPAANPYWSSIGPLVSYPQKVPLIRVTDRPVQLETPRIYFASDFTPNAAFYVRWHLAGEPLEVDLSRWELQVEGVVNSPLSLSLHDLMSMFPATTMAAVNQCSGNSRSRLQPRVPGSQWGNGAMGNARWTGARLRDILDHAGVGSGAVQIQFQGLERGPGPEGHPSHDFMKSLDVDNPVLDEAIVAWAMNGEPLPFLNGFPVRLVVPGYFATYWMKALTWIRVLDHADENFWMKTAYRIPATDDGSTSPEAMAQGTVKTIPIQRMPVRSLFVSPDGDTRLPVSMEIGLDGIAFSGYGRIVRVEYSVDDGQRWEDAELGPDHGPWSFRRWTGHWTPQQTGTYRLACRATDEQAHVQTDAAVWNPGGYLWNRIERQTVEVGGGPVIPRSVWIAVLIGMCTMTTAAQQIPQNPAEPGSGSVYRIEALPEYPTVLAAGPGRVLVQRYCSVCHSTTYITLQPPLPGKTWAAEVKKMMAVYGAAIPPQIAPRIVAYLQGHYTPDTIALTHPDTALAPSTGANIYADRCSVCHQPDAGGLAGVFPPLVPHVFRLTMKPEGHRYLAHVVLFGLQGPIEVNGAPYRGTMPAWGATLSDAQVAAVLTYINRPGTAFTATEVAEYRRHDCSPDQVHGEREELTR